MGGGKNYYEVLGVPAKASAKDIKRAYRKLVVKWHPDRNQSPEAPDVFNAIQHAYDTLADDGLRASYDAALAGDVRGWNDAVARQTPLMRACQSGNDAEVEALLAKKADVDARDALMQTALLYAAGANEGKFNDAAGNVSCLRAMLAAGANPDAMSEQGDTVMSLVCDSGNPGITMLLLARRASPNAVHADARVPLLCAADSGNQKVVKALLNARAVPRTADEGGLTALMCASERGNEEIVTALLEARADPTTQTVLGENALLFAVEGGVTGRLPEKVAIAITQRLLDAHADPFMTMLNQMTPIRMAASHNNSVFSTLLTEGAAKQAQLKAPGCWEGCCTIA
eukprot:TRINITY_DN22029_c0_g1_i1.p1 TRINITY_DN22029_c0_g1~~TRINITY_DN22029_c0_g1_i1.p1  ORF type:complete len:355 (-),score=72.13 TRINITY_DN22029_c0_g1_i1:200-1225(-)